SANNGVDYYKEQAQPKVTNLPDSVEDIKKELQERLDKVQKATLPSEAEQAVKEAENKAKEADNFLKEASEDGQITEDELETARKNNEEIEGLKEKAQAEIDKLP
ncbi:hypothetical protein B8A33_08320, partial [Dolosigranulum pigrum]|uniref:GA-like domain-containing protein n=1 Tax=Dolosigranulum pigrum TaxID=29394 RepID=UPI000DBFABDD